MDDKVPGVGLVSEIISIVRTHDKNYRPSGNRLVDERAAQFLREKLARALTNTKDMERG